MLNDSIIRSSIISLEKEYKGYKDGGREFIYRLCNEINKQNKKYKENIFNFFLEEIEDNKDGMTYIAIAALRHLNVTSVVASLEEIYNKSSKNKDDSWKNEVENLIFDLKK